MYACKLYAKFSKCLVTEGWSWGCAYGVNWALCVIVKCAILCGFVVRCVWQRPSNGQATSGGSGWLARGLRADIRRRLPHYLSDYTDGIHTLLTVFTGAWVSTEGTEGDNPKVPQVPPPKKKNWWMIQFPQHDSQLCFCISQGNLFKAEAGAKAVNLRQRKGQKLIMGCC